MTVIISYIHVILRWWWSISFLSLWRLHAVSSWGIKDLSLWIINNQPLPCADSFYSFHLDYWEGLEKKTSQGNFTSNIDCVNWFICSAIFQVMDRSIGLAVWVYAKGPGDRGSIPDLVMPKTKKMVLDASLLNTQHYKVLIKSKVEQSKERNSVPSTTIFPESSDYFFIQSWPQI